MSQLNEKEQKNVFNDTVITDLSESDQFKYRQGQAVYRHICERARCESVSTLVSELWYTLGYCYETQWNVQTAVYSELYDYLFHLAVKCDEGEQGLAAFTDSIQKIRNKEKKITDIEIPLERSGAVQLTTIHKSKGLEYPVVFLCCCDKTSKNDTSEAVFFTGEAGTAISPPCPEKIAHLKDIRKNYFWENYSVETRRKRTAELRRLLYVGMTRAEREVYLSGCLEIRESSQDKQNPISDFSLLFKKYTENKLVNISKERVVVQDTIIDDDTFFGLCLPAFASHIPDEGLNAKQSFFTVEEIPAYSDDEVHTRETGTTFLVNNQKGLNTFIKNTEHFYTSAVEIPVPVIQDNRFTPTSLKHLWQRSDDAQSMGKEEFTQRRSDAECAEIKEELEYRKNANQRFSGEDAGDVFKEVDSVLNRFAQADDDEEYFSAAGFGIIAHACVEAMLKKEEIKIPERLSGFLTPSESSVFLKAGKELAARFIRSPLGKIALKAKNRKSEFPFRTLKLNADGGEIFINGTIDLLFEDEHTVYVVDFKTDSHENPHDHAAQMNCYAYAANELLARPQGKKCSVWLYYLRTGHAYISGNNMSVIGDDK